ncbi:MAG: hypothetical protein OHK0054_11200 [Sideroxydans sp.]
MDIIKLNPARGWTWIKQGYQLIMISPLLAIATALIGAFSLFLVMLVPLFGPLLAVLLLPVLLAGYARICRALEEHEEVELPFLLAGFRRHTSALVTLGALLMLGMLAASVLMATVGGEALAELMQQARTMQDPQALFEALAGAGGQIRVGLLLGFTLMLVLMLAWQYTPMLVFFSGLPPVLALRYSFTGTLRNVLPYTVYSLLLQLIALLLGLLPFGLGMVLLLPLGLTSLYVSYRNIFPWLDAEPGTPVTAVQE